jgi:HlyD family secretion protein
VKKKALVPVVLLLAIAAGVTAWWILRPRPAEGVLEASGTVEATDGQIGFEAAGTIDRILVHEGDRVTAGQLLAELDRREMEARRRQAEAAVAAARAHLADLEEGFRSEEVEEARAAVAAAEDHLEDAERDLQRTDKLYQGGAVPKEALDKASLAREVADSQLKQARERLRLLESGYRRQQIVAQRSQLDQAQAAVEALDVALALRSLKAPFAGIVTVKHREPGEVVAPGSPVVTLLDPDDRWVRIYVREDAIGAVHLGGDATIRSDTFPDKRYPGEVTFVATEAEFTPKNVQTQEERVRLVYAVKVRITGDSDYELKPGMPVDVFLDTGAAGAEEG